MPIRLKVIRKQEERIKKVAELVNMWKVPGYPTYNYQPIGASAINLNPRIAKTRELWQMFHLDR